MQSEVLIVGGGLSGLALARLLERGGVDYLLVEARDRLGGRILSLPAHAGAAPRDRYDLGPAWFWPGQPRMTRLVRDLGLTAFEQHSAGDLVFQAADGAVGRHRFSTMAGSLRLEGGFSGLTEGIAKRLTGTTPMLGHQVVGLSRTDTGVLATVREGAEELRIAAARVVLAIPPRLAARAIRFEPRLDPAARRAMAGIPTWMGGHTKVVAIYRRPFWRGSGLSGDGASHRGPLEEVHDASPSSSSSTEKASEAAEGALFGFVASRPSGPRRGGFDLRSEAIAQLAAMYGPEAGAPLQVLIQDWAQEAHTATPDDARATASEHPVYGTPPALTHLWDCRLILASTEMAPEFGGFLEGALEAADQALRALSD